MDRWRGEGEEDLVTIKEELALRAKLGDSPTHDQLREALPQLIQSPALYERYRDRLLNPQPAPQPDARPVPQSMEEAAERRKADRLAALQADPASYENVRDALLSTGEFPADDDEPTP
jgi:hypothetical protein